MGACEFIEVGHADTAKAAFEQLVDEALHMHGHGGYTGTIAEKQGYGFKSCGRAETVEAAMDKAEAHLQRDTIDKWGPALCIVTGETNAKGLRAFVFYGLASS